MKLIAQTPTGCFAWHCAWDTLDKAIRFMPPWMPNEAQFSLIADEPNPFMTYYF